jgi:hypothetical protein
LVIIASFQIITHINKNRGQQGKYRPNHYDIQTIPEAK